MTDNLLSNRTRAGVELQISNARWLAYLGVGLGFLLIWMIDPARFQIYHLSSTGFIVTAVCALAFNGLWTHISRRGVWHDYFPAVSYLLDVLLAAGMYYFVVGPKDHAAFVIDPLILVVLLPSVTAAIRYQWITGALLGLVTGMIRTFIMLRNRSGVIEPVTVLVALTTVYFTLGVAFLSSHLVYLSVGIGIKRELTRVRDELDQSRTKIAQSKRVLRMDIPPDNTSVQLVMNRVLETIEYTFRDWGLYEGFQSAILVMEDDQPTVTRHHDVTDSGKILELDQKTIDELLSIREITTVTPDDTPTDLAPVLQSNSPTVIAPLKKGKKVFGSILVSAEHLDPSSEQCELLAGIADRASLAAESALLYRELEQEKQRILQIEEEARHQLSRDLHDGPAQQIAVIVMRLEHIRRRYADQIPSLGQELDRVEKLAQGTMEDVRHMLFTLRPLVLETDGLKQALVALADRYDITYGLEVRIHAPDEIEQALDLQQSSVVFNITEEALQNVVKHADASIAQIRLRTDNKHVLCEVQDDGKGFDVREVWKNYSTRGSMGMLSMNERAERAGGKLEVKSLPGVGTTVAFQLPSRVENSRRENKGQKLNRAAG